MFSVLKTITLLCIVFTLLSLGHLINGAYINPPDEGVTQRWILLSQFCILIGGLLSLILGYIGRIINKRKKRKIDKLSLAGIITGIIISFLVIALLFLNKFFPT